MERLYKIGEFSKMTSLSIKTLRYYDQIDLLRPVKVDEQNSYRWYDESSYERALLIQTLKTFEFSIQEMLEVVPRVTDENDLSAFLMEKSAQLTDRIKSAKKLQRSIDEKVQLLKEVKNMTTQNTICVKEIPEMLVATVRYKGKYSDMGQYISQLYKAVGGNTNGVVTALYYDDSYREEDADIEVAIPIKKAIQKEGIVCRTLPAQKCLSVLHRGPYDQLSRSYKATLDYLADHGMTAVAPSREVYLKGPGMLMKGNPETYETEILMPLG